MVTTHAVALSYAEVSDSMSLKMNLKMLGQKSLVYGDDMGVARCKPIVWENKKVLLGNRNKRLGKKTTIDSAVNSRAHFRQSSTDRSHKEFINRALASGVDVDVFQKRTLHGLDEARKIIDTHGSENRFPDVRTI